MQWACFQCCPENTQEPCVRLRKGQEVRFMSFRGVGSKMRVEKSQRIENSSENEMVTSIILAVNRLHLTSASKSAQPLRSVGQLHSWKLRECKVPFYLYGGTWQLPHLFITEWVPPHHRQGAFLPTWRLKGRLSFFLSPLTFYPTLRESWSVSHQL